MKRWKMENINNLDSENNVNNYGKRADFASFIVPEDVDVSVVEVSWDDALDFATHEMTEDDEIALGLVED